MNRRVISTVRLALIALLLACTFASAAQADMTTAPLPTDRPFVNLRVSESLRLAEEFYGQKVLCHVSTYEATSSDLLAGVVRDPSTYGAANFSIGGAAQLGSIEGQECPIWLNDNDSGDSFLNRVMSCAVIFHEYGHLLGYDHPDVVALAANLHSIMAALMTTVPYPCYRRFVPKGGGAMYRDYFDSMFHTPIVWSTRP